MLQFETTVDLENWLRVHDVDVSRWGRGAAKSVGDLWAEITKGESIMQNEAPLRSVEAVRVVVRRDECVLIEAHQGFSSGRRRERGRPPSEKMHPGEHYKDAAIRCLREELGVAVECVQLQHETYRRKVRQGDPDSYPGLCTRYTFHIVDAVVQGLPDHDFSTREQATGPGEPIGLHFWEWRQRRDAG